MVETLYQGFQVSEGSHMDIWIYRCMDIYIYMRYMDILINGYIDILINGYMDISGVSCIYQGLNVYLSVVFPAYQVFQVFMGFREENI